MRSALLIIVVAIAGCATGYKSFYQAYPNTQQVLERRIAAAPAKPAVERASGKVDDVFASYMRRGYRPIGYSSFNSGRAEGDSGAISQGSKVGADLVVIFDPRLTDRRTASVPITTPTSSTSYTTGSATAYGSGGSATAYGNSTTTTYGTQTTYIPITVSRYDFGAIYFVRSRPYLGAYFRDLTDDERHELQSNRGAMVTLIVDDSPAFVNDVLVGDIIVSLNGQLLSGAESLSSLIQLNHGNSVTIEIIRGKQKLSKNVGLLD